MSNRIVIDGFSYKQNEVLTARLKSIKTSGEASEDGSTGRSMLRFDNGVNVGFNGALPLDLVGRTLRYSMTSRGHYQIINDVETGKDYIVEKQQTEN